MSGAPAGGPVRALLDAVRAGTAGAALPPIVVDGPQGTVAVYRDLRGEHHAAVVGELLTDDVAVFLDVVERWHARTADRYAAVVPPPLLAATNPDLFGPVLCDVFAGSVLTGGGDADAAAGRARRCTAALELFLRRLRADLRDGWPPDPALRGPVTRLRTPDGEPHNGGQRVLRVDLAGGGSVAYKPRPVTGERLLTAVFGLLNAQPAAAGPIRLPTLECWGGHGYGWQRWVSPGRAWGVIRAEGPWTQHGTRLTPERARTYWHRAGSLAAACFGYGVCDLHGENVVVGVPDGANPDGEDPDGGEVLPHPVDTEVCFARVTTLYDTDLLQGPEGTGTHHVGLEHEARWCGPGGPRFVWREEPDGGLTLQRRDRPVTRRRTTVVVADTDGRTGYGAYLPVLLRGMFDAWTQMCAHRDRVRRLVADLDGDRFVRVVPRPTADYERASPDEMSPDGTFREAEVAQMRRGDVPYFLRSLDGGPVLEIAPAPRPFATAPSTLSAGPGWLPVAAVRDGTDLTLAGLGTALRDAVAAVVDGTGPHVRTDPDAGVRLAVTDRCTGRVEFDWARTGRVVTYAWDRRRMRLRITRTVPAAAAAAARDRLLRLDRVDGHLRDRWALGGFADDGLRRELERLTGAALRWLREWVARHGLPDAALVGADAAAAGSRLVQHLTDAAAFQRDYLDLMRDAATLGRMPWREVAYLTDTVLLAQRRPQRYGTKFERVGGALRPYPLEDPDEVDARRAAMGLEPLAATVARVTELFGTVR